MSIRPIHTPDDHRAALARIEAIWNAEPGTPEGDELEVLATLVDAYERQAHPIGPPDPIEAIKFRLEQLGIDRKALEPLIGTRARVSEVLTRKRRLSLSMIRRLHRELHIPLDVLVAEPKARAARGQTKRPRSFTRSRVEGH
jgi:HTH-type transcriptional regulator/antitoxin HigA